MNSSKKICLMLILCGATTLQASLPAGIIKLTTGIFANGGQAIDVKIQTGAGSSGQAGKIVVCGYTLVGGQRRWTVARFTTQGLLDTTFNAADTPGYWQSATNGSEALCVAIDPNDDTIFVGGLAGPSTSSSRIRKYTATGTLTLNVIPTGLATTPGGRFFGLTVLGSTVYAVGITGPAANQAQLTLCVLSSTTLEPTAPLRLDSSGQGTYVSLRGGVAFANSVMYGSMARISGSTPNRQGRYTPPGVLNFSTGAGRVGFMITHPSDNLPRLTLTNGTNQVIIAQNSSQATTATYNIVANNLSSFPYGYGGGIALANATTTSPMVTCACNSSRAPYIARILANGTLDNTFGTNGVTQETDGLIIPGYYSNVAVQSDGKAVVAGFTEDQIGAGEWIIARYTTNGSRDSSFGVDPLEGVLQDTAAPFDTVDNGFILTTTIDQSGKLVVGGYYGEESVVARYLVDTAPARDSTFNTNGVSLGGFAITPSVINKVIVSPDDLYYVVGKSNNFFTTGAYENNGTLTNFYGYTVETGLGAGEAFDMILNGTAFAAAGFINTNVPAVINYNATDGARSTILGDRGVQTFGTFGSGALYGIATTTDTTRYGAGQGTNLAFVRSLGNPVGALQDTAAPFNTGANALLYSTTITQGGNLVVGGQYNTTWTVASYTPAGARNTSFNTNGVAVAPSGFDTGRVRAVIIDNTGRILATGTTRIGGSDENPTAVRYNSAGTSTTTARETAFGVGSGLGIYLKTDNSFEVAGFTTTGGQQTPTVLSYDSSAVLTNSDQFTTLVPGQFYAIQEADGSFFAAGSSVDTAILYPLLDGTGLLRDTAPPFDTGFSGRMFGGILDSDQKIVLCGNYNNVFTELRYTTTGGRDGNFFGADGVVQLPELNAATGYAVAQDSAGNYYIAAESTVSGTIVFTLVKISNTGDLEFVVQETGLGVGRARAVEINTDGTVVVGGQTTVSGVLLPTLINYTAAGQKIPTFGTNGVQIVTTYGTGVVNGLSIISPASVAAVAQMSLKATLLQYGQSNDLLDELNNGF